MIQNGYWTEKVIRIIIRRREKDTEHIKERIGARMRLNRISFILMAFILTIDMLAGRLEILPMMILLLPKTWYGNN